MEYFKISKPDLSRLKTQDLFQKYYANINQILEYTRLINDPVYLSWEKARFINPPKGFSPEEAWYLARVIPAASGLTLPITTPDGDHFRWTRLDYTDRLLHEFDMYMGGQFMTDKVRVSNSEQQIFLTRGVIEESIASSQLEGASVTRKQAKDMLAENRTPADISEWMVYNNYLMMTKITEVYKDVPLSSELLLDMHRLLTANTMKKADIGRFRRNADKIVVGNEQVTTYVPPKAKFVAEQLKSLIDFANNDDPAQFIHPVIKAIILHFWVGYLHPFVDGNGRIARAIFYWLLLKKNYSVATYMSLSTVIKRAPIQYSDAYVNSEQDNNNFTYFYDYHMRKIKRSLDEFLEYVEKQRQENRQIDRLLLTSGRLNERQKQAMHYLLSDQKNSVNITTHSNLNRISLNTARADLMELQKLKLIVGIRSGKYIRYFARTL